jgi:hypothetical protein
MKRQHATTWKSGLMACGAALFAACGQDAATSDGTDAASAYAELSASVQACADKKDQCVADAAGDAAKVSACDTAAEACMQKTQGKQAEARRRLDDDAQGCMRQHGSKGAGGAGGGTAAGSEMHKCVERHAPSASACMPDLFACLDKTGLKMSTPGADLDQATKDAIVACVQTAHTCIMSDMASHPHGGHVGAGEHAQAGHHAPGAGGHPAFPGAEAGHGSHHTGGGAAPTSPRGPRGEGGGPGRHHEEAGAGGS